MRKIKLQKQNELMLKFAEENLGETEKLRLETVSKIKEWLIESKSELNARIDDEYWILSFLRGSKFDLDKTKRKIKTHLKLRATTPEWFLNRDPLLPEIQHLLDLGVVLPLREFDEEGRLVIIFRTGIHDPTLYSINDVIKVYHMILDIALKEFKQATIYGIVAILDMKCVTFRHMFQVTPTIIKKCIIAWENYCFKPKSIDIFNAPRIFNFVLNIAKTLVSRKLLDRMHVHSPSVLVNEIVPKKILPKEYGGDTLDLEELKKYWKNKCVDYSDWFVKDEKYRALKI